MAPEPSREMLPGTALEVEVMPRQELVTVEDLVHDAELRASAMRQIIVRSLKETLPTDWVKMGDFLYLQGKGAERIRKIFNLKIVDKDIKKFSEQDAKGRYYLFVVSARAVLEVRPRAAP